MVGKGPNYTLDSTSSDNSGNYTCSAYNDITNITKMVTKEIRVIGKSSYFVSYSKSPYGGHRDALITIVMIGDKQGDCLHGQFITSQVVILSFI